MASASERVRIWPSRCWFSLSGRPRDHRPAAGRPAAPRQGAGLGKSGLDSCRQRKEPRAVGKTRLPRATCRPGHRGKQNLKRMRNMRYSRPIGQLRRGESSPKIWCCSSPRDAFFPPGKSIPHLWSLRTKTFPSFSINAFCPTQNNASLLIFKIYQKFYRPVRGIKMSYCLWG